jgi:hypothetical protein
MLALVLPLPLFGSPKPPFPLLDDPDPEDALGGVVGDDRAQSAPPGPLRPAVTRGHAIAAVGRLAVPPAARWLPLSATARVEAVPAAGLTVASGLAVARLLVSARLVGGRVAGRAVSRRRLVGRREAEGLGEGSGMVGSGGSGGLIRLLLARACRITGVDPLAVGRLIGLVCIGKSGLTR